MSHGRNNTFWKESNLDDFANSMSEKFVKTITSNIVESFEVWSCSF